MKIKNDLVRIKVGKKKYDFHNLILNEYLRRFALAQIDKENTLKGKLTQSRELNYILLKLDTSLEITESSKLYYNDFDICIINQAKHFQDLSENQITIQYDYNTKENMFVVDISVSSQATETTSGTIKSLNNFYGKKITAIGFSSGWAPWANYPICAVLDTSNYNIYLEENQEFSVTRRDIITTDAEFYSNDKDKVPAPIHLAPYGVPQIINQPDIVDSEGTINSFYSNAYGALYSIGKGYVPNVIEEEKIIGENAKVVNNGTSLTISSVENEDVGTEALYPSEDLYPIGKFVEEIQTSEKGVQVSIKGNEEDAFVQIDGKSTQATRSGKNKFDLAKVNTSNIVVLNNTGFNLVKAWATQIINNTNLIQMLKPSTTYTCYSKAKVKGRPSYTSTSNHNLVLILYKDGVAPRQLSVIDKTLDIEQISVKTFTTPDDLDGWSMLGYAFHGNNDGSTTYKGIGEIEVKDLMIVEGTYTAENFPDFEMYGASPSPEFPSEIKSVGDDVNLLDINNNWENVGSLVYQIDLEENEKYVIKINNPDTSRSYRIKCSTDKQGYSDFDITLNSSNSYTTKITYTIRKENIGKKTGLIIWDRVTSNNLTFEEAKNLNIKIQKGTVATSYSEYGKGTVTIEQRGKNKLDLSKCTFINCRLNNDGTITSNINNGYYSEINTTELNEFIMKNKGMPITFSIKEIIENANISVVVRGTRTNGENYQDVNKNNDNKCTITIADDFTKITGLSLRFNRKFTPFTDTTTTVSNLQLEEGDTATDYEPYFSKDYVIPLSAPLRSLPNGTKDTIEEDGIHRRVGSEIITMNDIAKANTSYSNVVYAQITKPNNFIGYNNYNYNAVLCNKAESLKLPVGNFDNNKMIGKINTEAHKTMFWIGFPVGTTLDEMKSILDGTIIQYELAEEVVEPFTEEQLEVINSIETQKGTNIFSVNNELNPEIKVTEYKSPLYPIKDNYKYIILKYKVWQEVATGEYTEEDGYIQEITDTGYYYHQAIPLEEYGTLNTTIKYERG